MFHVLPQLFKSTAYNQELLLKFWPEILADTIFSWKNIEWFRTSWVQLDLLEELTWW